MNYKKTVNIILRCGLYVYIISRMFNMCAGFNIFFAISFLKNLLDMCLVDICTLSLVDVPDSESENSAFLIVTLNVLFFAYFYAKICGIYKLFKDYKLWQKGLIFLGLSISSYFVGMFDFKNLKLFDDFYFENNNFTIIYVSIFVIFAFVLNLIFEFLTKKFPKPFEKIGYWVSIEFYKNLFKKMKSKIKG